MNGEADLQWFVAKTKAKQEKTIREQIEALGVQTFLPIRTEIRKWSDRMKKIDVVLLPNTLFIRAKKQDAINLHNVNGIAISYLRDITKHSPGSMLVVPDAQMDSFRKFVELTQGQYDVEDDLLYQKGDKVIVVSGPLKGILGELVRVNGHDKVVVRLDNLIACSVPLSTDCIEKVNDLL